MTNTDRITIELVWQGPYKWHSLSPNRRSGLYLWVVGKHPNFTLSYVGEAQNVRIRLRDEIRDLLGGGAWIWKLSDLRASSLGAGEYEPDIDASEFYERFLKKTDEYQAKARENLREYSFFFAHAEEFEDSKLRKAVESALIKSAEIEFGLFPGYKSNWYSRKCVQNSRISHIGPAVRWKSKFAQNDINVNGIVKNSWLTRDPEAES